MRWAEGKATEKGGVYLRHAKAWGPSALRRVKIQEQKKVGEHTWNSTDGDVERPNRVVMDLDPAPDVKWREVARAARLVRALGLESFVKTTGGKGLHVVVPLEPEADWDETSAFTRAFARLDYLRNNRGNTSVALARDPWARYPKVRQRLPRSAR